MIKSIDSCYLHIKNIYIHIYTWGFPGGLVVKKPPANIGDIRDRNSIPWLR